MGFLKRLIGLEKRATLANPPDWLVSALIGGDVTLSGVNVSPSKALTLSSYFAAIRAISEDVAKLPLVVYRRLKPRGKERATGHPLFKLLHDSPNAEQSSMSFRETLTLHAIGWGNGLAEIVRNKNGLPVALWILDPSRVRIERDSSRQLRYIIPRTQFNDREIVLLPADVFHLHGLGFDGTTGYSVAHLARESIGLGLAAEKSGASLFGNGARPDGILTMPGKLSPEARENITKSWERRHKGPDRQHRVAVMDQGLEFKTMSLPNRDAQWIEARQFTVTEMARWLRIPPHKIGQLGDATFSNVESQAREYVTDTLQPWMVRWEQEIRRKLIAPGAPLFAEHLVDSLLRGDTETRFNAYRTAIESGFMTRNEVREKENLNPLPGLDAIIQPLNMGQPGNGTNTGP